MKKQKITIKEDSLLIENSNQDYPGIDNVTRELIAIQLAYDECKCATCQIMVINKADDLVSAEIYRWFEILEGPINSPFEIESETIDEAIIQITSLQEVLNTFNELRKSILNS